MHDLAALGLRRLEPETAHRLTLRALAAGLGPRDARLDDPALAVDMAGLRLPNCVGLAAGFDKNCEAPGAMLAAGFGMVECGTVTPRPQDGNPRPRVFRLSEDRGLVNRLGFNNAGLEAFAERLEARPRRDLAEDGARGGGVVGANLGANKDSADRTADYVAGLERLWPWADYFTVNISSPNTPGLRTLQSRGALEELCGRLAEARERLLTVRHGRDLEQDRRPPILLKVAPELNDREIRDVCEATTAAGINGLVISNTSVDRSADLRSASRGEAGGLSGAPLFAQATDTLRRFNHVNERRLALIGAGGVASGADAYAKIRAGACAVQLYTALVYEGPGVVARIKRDLAARLRADGFASVCEARGTG